MGNEADSDSEGRDQIRREKWKQNQGGWYGITLSSKIKVYTVFKKRKPNSTGICQSKTEEVCLHDANFRVNLINWWLFVS